VGTEKNGKRFFTRARRDTCTAAALTRRQRIIQNALS
jgi:hypothetical protein